jgi:hypothetical protein
MMDERIKELRNLAWEEIYGVDPDDPRVARAHAHMEEGMAKFAELIVRECINVALNEIASDENISDAKEEWKHYLRGYNGGIMDSIYAVQQHFGSE